MFTLTTYSQLKAMSDPLRVEMMMRLCERPYTGQLLSEIRHSKGENSLSFKRIREKWFYRNRIYRRKKWHRSKVLSICR